MNTAERCVRLVSLRSFSPSLVALFLLALVVSESHSASVGWDSPPPAASRVPMTLPGQQLKRDYLATAIPLQIVLDPVTAAEKATLAAPRKGQPLKVGFARDMPPPYQGDLSPWLTWESLPGGGQVAAFSVTSPGARAIRVGIELEGLPENAEMRFFGSKNSDTFGPFTAPARPAGGERCRRRTDPGFVLVAGDRGRDHWGGGLSARAGGKWVSDAGAQDTAPGIFASVSRRKEPF